MATIQSVLAKQPNCLIHNFSPMRLGDTSEPLQSDGMNNSVQVFGAFGLLGAVVIEGSNDGGGNWAQLSDVNGSALNIGAAGMRVFNAPVGKIRARVAAGDGSTSLTVLFRC